MSGNMKSIVVIGAGGFGRGARDVIDEINAQQQTWCFLGFLDDNIEIHDVIGTPDELLSARPDAYVIAIADPVIRNRLDRHDCDASPLIAPSARFGRDSTPGSGTIVRSNVSVASNVIFGRHVHLNMNVTIGHDATLGDYVTVHPGANVSGNVSLGAGVTIGAGAVILPGVEVGEHATVGAGAVVLDDVPPGTVAVGVPAVIAQRF
ncbi:transferase [Egicoccus sp. AB-alg2]|uniref:PglD-related sugar-binding protein n=1 Tax=Egicoccus sp. AB-alg2 TaxID=3242693 RepID=UPI00359D105C